MILNDTFTSTGAKFFAHQQAMHNLRAKQGQPITTHVMLTDVCNHTCAFCSVQHRAGDALPFDTVTGYLTTLLKYGLKSVILSGGGNPILYKCKQSGKDFNDVVDWIHKQGLEIGLITNGMKREEFLTETGRRYSWLTVEPSTLDKLTWVRISMAGLDHKELTVYVPEIDPAKTTLGFSYVAHDIYDAPEDPHHGKVSTQSDVIKLGHVYDNRVIWRFENRIIELTEKFIYYCETFNPRYLRLLPNCLEPSQIEYRCKLLNEMADDVNKAIGQEVAFVQYKPPAPPRACYLGYIHPVLNCDGYVYPCDSCVLNEKADHQFGQTWRICHWSDVSSIYETPVKSLISNPSKTCPGCVFHKSNTLLDEVVNGTIDLTPPKETPEHANFV